MTTERTAGGEVRDGRHDFDFFVGTWSIRNRRLRERLRGTDAWEEFPGKAVVRKVMGGLANVGEFTMERPAGPFEGITLRIYDPASRQWSLYWADNLTATLYTPMVGGFQDGRGEFYAQETFDGRSIYSRFIWSDITPTSCRWEQAYSADGGATWETNWIMEFRRVE